MEPERKGEQDKSGEASKASAESQQKGADTRSKAESRSDGDAIALLKADHRKVEGLFERCKKAKGDQKSDLIEQICRELAIHTELEEQIFYPACREEIGDELLNEAQVEHDCTKLLLADLARDDDRDSFLDAKLKVLSELVLQHIREEEQPGQGVFAKAQASQMDMEALGRELRNRKQELQEDLEDEAPQFQFMAVKGSVRPAQPRRRRGSQGRQAYGGDPWGRYPEAESGGRAGRSGEYGRSFADEPRSFGRGGYEEERHDHQGRGDHGRYRDWGERGESRDMHRRSGQGSGYGGRGERDEPSTRFERWREEDDDFGRRGQSRREW